MGQVVLKGKGDIHEITEFLTEQMIGLTCNLSHKIHREIGMNEFVLLIFEKHFIRNNSRASLTVLINRDSDELIVDVIGSGGGTGLIFNFSWGANTDFAHKVSEILNSKGFQILSENACSY